MTNVKTQPILLKSRRSLVITLRNYNTMENSYEMDRFLNTRRYKDTEQFHINETEEVILLKKKNLPTKKNPCPDSLLNSARTLEKI